MAIPKLSEALDRAKAGGPTCQIPWIDVQGNPTPDSNPAVARARPKAPVEQYHGRAIQFDQSQWFYICAEHAKQLSEPGMEIWECEAFKAMSRPV